MFCNGIELSHITVLCRDVWGLQLSSQPSLFLGGLGREKSDTMRTVNKVSQLDRSSQATLQVSRLLIGGTPHPSAPWFVFSKVSQLLSRSAQTYNAHKVKMAKSLFWVETSRL